MGKCVILLLILFFTHSVVAAQNTLKKKPFFAADVEFWAGYIHYPYNLKVHRPEYLNRYPSYLNSSRIADTLNDTPLKHAAFYAAIKTTTTLSEGIRVKVDIYGEHRGISYGMYNQKNTVVYPVMLLEAEDSVNILKHTFKGEGKIGYFLNKRLNEGLFIYNIDVQGAEAIVSVNKWKASAVFYGDFYYGIGLEIDDIGVLTISKSFGEKNNTVAGASVMTAYPAQGEIFDNLYYSFFTRHFFKDYSVYAEAGIQSSHNKGSYYSRGIANQAAFVVGGKWNHQTQKVSFTNTFELRYYGSSLNLFHSDNRIRYRDTAGGFYANTVGKYLYPLRKYETPFSQWAVFTEYITCNIFGISLTGNIGYATSKKTELGLDYDVNYLSASENTNYNTAGKKSTILYTFFTAGFYYKPLKHFKAGITLTNKGMNLDKGYPTFYQYKAPYVGFRFYREI